MSDQWIKIASELPTIEPTAAFFAELRAVLAKSEEAIVGFEEHITVRDQTIATLAREYATVQANVDALTATLSAIEAREEVLRSGLAQLTNPLGGSGTLPLGDVSTIARETLAKANMMR